MCLAIPGKIESVRDHGELLQRTGRVSFGGIIKEISLACTPEAGVGDYVLVHAGIAIATIDEEAAQETLRYLERIEELDEPNETTS
jgi:hydrogenase expression/formation protein HypC